MSTLEDERVSGRRHWRLLWLSSIQAFSDAQTQKQRWLDTTERNPHFSFVECRASYFEDVQMGEEKAFDQRLAEGYLSPEEVEATKPFHALAERYRGPTDDHYDLRAIINDPVWNAVVQAAQAAKERLLGLIGDGDERNALSQPVHWEERNGAFYADALKSRIVPAGQWAAEQTSTGAKRWVVDQLGKLCGKAGR